MRRYYSFNAYLKDKFPGLRVYKIALDAGFTCPHRSGPDRTGGCIYCENRSFSPNARLDPRPSISEQLRMGMDFYRRKYQADKFIAYFQAYSNTLGPIELLKQRYDEALSGTDVVGLDIGTRPDCISDEAINLIASYTDKYTVWVEYGLQSADDKTLALINRGHTYADFESAVKRTRNKNIAIGTHLIIGLPGETNDTIINSARKVAGLGIDSVKLHHLYIAKNTELANLYGSGKVQIMSLAQYIPLVCDILEILPPQMIVQRLTGELSGEYLIAPKWEASKNTIIGMIEKELERRNSYQGCKYKQP
ncbi:MAG: TIGR01212 family radical SAM protein [Candidatus Brocadiia bacterium]